LTLTLARTPPSSLCYLIKINETVHGVSLVHRDAHLMPDIVLRPGLLSLFGRDVGAGRRLRLRRR